MHAPDRIGFLPVLGYRLYYEIYEPGRRSLRRGTVLGLHGGPGATHDYIHPFADLTRFGHRVVLFDQLGCGRSELPLTYRPFTLEHNVREVEALRRGLRLGPVHLIGSSYGGLLALASVLAHPTSFRSVITVGGLADVPLTVREMVRLKRGLPPTVRRTLAHFERLGEYDHPEYQAAVLAFYRRHLIRLDPWPPDVAYSMEHLSRPVYLSMNGPNEFTITGRIRRIDLTPRLRAIRRPTLVLGGRYDEVTPRVADAIRRHVPGATGHTFERSSHMPFWEERSGFVRVVARFLRAVERGGGSVPS